MIHAESLCDYWSAAFKEQKRMKNKINMVLQSSLMRATYLGLVFGMLLTATVQGIQAQEKSKESAAPKLAGEWKLNEQLSDDSRAKMQEMMKSGAGNHSEGMGGGGGAANHGGMGGGGMPPSREQMEEWRKQITLALESPKTLLITQSGGETTIRETHVGERTRTFYTDGRKSEKSDVEVKVKNSQLLIKTSTGGPKIVETYELSADGKQLIVIVKVERMMGGGMSLRRVYDAS
jgi:hypothetical protein